MQENQARRENRFDGVSGRTICAQCGYRFIRGDIILRVHQTGDMIHKDCFMDYADDNVEEMCDEFEM